MPTRSPCGSGGAQPSRCQSAAARSSARASGCSSTRTTLPELPEELRPRDPPLDRLDPAFCYVARTTLQLRRPRGLKVPVVRVLQAGEHLLHEPSPLGAGEPQDLREQFFRRHGRHVVRSGRRCTTLSRGSPRELAQRCRHAPCAGRTARDFRRRFNQGQVLPAHASAVSPCWADVSALHRRWHMGTPESPWSFFAVRVHNSRNVVMLKCPFRSSQSHSSNGAVTRDRPNSAKATYAARLSMVTKVASRSSVAHTATDTSSPRSLTAVALCGRRCPHSIEAASGPPS
jgi:hypothetical protein